jgi:hypothetical protein
MSPMTDLTNAAMDTSCRSASFEIISKSSSFTGVCMMFRFGLFLRTATECLLLLDKYVSI